MEGPGRDRSGPSSHLQKETHVPHPTIRLALLVPTAFVAVLAVAGESAAQLCNNLTGSVIHKPRLFVGHLTKPPGAQTLTFSGTAEMPSVPPIDPLDNGFRFVVSDAQDDVVIDATVPPGAYSPVTRNGWRDNGRGGFFYKNNDGPLNDGIFAVTVNELRSKPGTFQFRVRAKAGSYAVAPADLPLAVTVVLDPPTAETTGQCSEAQYATECRFNKALSTVRCKPPV
jgi:hypothetical protein